MFCSFFDRDTCWRLPPAIQACVREVGLAWAFPLIFHRSPIRLVQPEFSPRDYGTA